MLSSLAVHFRPIGASETRVSQQKAPDGSVSTRGVPYPVFPVEPGIFSIPRLGHKNFSLNQ